ncbi:MAG: hydroxyacid dehydrogenase [Clostridiales bacterium]|nr:hydroxyacid dehydrogenase [Clostridiales bacterium]
MKIVLTESLGIPDSALDELVKPFTDAGHAFVKYEKTADTAVLREETKDADVIMLANMPMPAEVLRQCESLKYVDIAFTGVDHVAMDVLRERGIPASNASGYSTEAVAELGVGMAVSMLRNMRQTEDRCRSHGTKAGLVGTELKGKTVGIVGLGHIGSRSAELFRAFGCRILASSRTVHADCPDYIRQVSLNELLQSSDLVLLHCPLNASTRGLIGREQLAMMKRTAVLINLARGPVADSAALKEALEAGVIAGAASDVFAKEPPLDDSEPLLSAPNTLLTPHIAFATEESMQMRAEIVFDNLRAFLKGEILNAV